MSRKINAYALCWRLRAYAPFTTTLPAATARDQLRVQRSVTNEYGTTLPLTSSVVRTNIETNREIDGRECLRVIDLDYTGQWVYCKRPTDWTSLVLAVHSSLPLSPTPHCSIRTIGIPKSGPRFLYSPHHAHEVVYKRCA